MSNRVFYGILTILSVVFLGFFIGYSAKSKPIPEQPIVSKTGIHRHPELAIYIKGKQQVIPPDIGSSRYYTGPVHTHDSSGVLHYEIGGPVRKNFVQLKMFFSTWGQPFDATDLLSYRNVPKGSIKMTVNGKPNTQFGNYQVKDKDKIVVSYR